jgi:glycosyltransferase involved in cell wall biosynthesis
MLDSQDPALVMEYDIETPPIHPASLFASYRRAFVVFRFGPAVVGSSWIEISDGQLAPVKLTTAVHDLVEPLRRLQQDGSREPLAGRSASVAICTRDRADLLKQCLDSLKHLIGTEHEVIVIDNCPSDSRTEELVGRYPGVRYILEPRPGEGFARNRALRESRRDFVAFTDDDARVDRLWLDCLLSNFADPAVALATGITMPLELETESQLWFERIHGFGKGFRRVTADIRNTNPLRAGRLGASVNMALRRSVVDEVGYFDEALGTGTIARCGTDHEYFYRILAGGFRAVYDPCALVWHRHRREYRALRSTMRGYGVGVFAWWTRALFIERELSVLLAGPRYFGLLFHRVMLTFVPGSKSFPRDLVFAEFLGALAGPVSYLRSRRRIKRYSETSLGERAGETAAVR